jgi:enamine deaminase RidA (YjgF/YER057c/UK114 family)
MRASGERNAALRLQDLGLALPEPSRPLGRYVPVVRTGSLLVLSGMLPLEGGRLVVVGRLGGGVSVDEGRAAARLAALNALATADQALGLQRVRRVLRATVSMATTSEFTAHAAVADGASELFASLFDEGHTRVALGAYSLPMGSPVVLDVTFELHPESGS